MAVDPFAALFAQIESWPTASPSSEVVVVRREGADVVFITPPPRLEPVPKPLEFRVPLEGSTLPAARAVVQGDGEWIGPDYRGVEVLTASRRVNGVPWIVVAKTDVAEITQPLRRKELTLTLVIGAAVVLAACAPWLAVLIARHNRDAAPVYRRAVILGLWLTFVLGAVAGMYMGSRGAHWIGGTASDAGGVPLIGWWLRDRVQGGALVTMAAGVLGVATIGVFVQALLGQPLL